MIKQFLIKQKTFFWRSILFFILGVPFLSHFNIPYSVVYVLALGTLTLYFTTENGLKFSAQKVTLFVLFLSLAAIDKLNDFFYSVSFTQFLPLIYSVCIYVFLMGLKESEILQFWKTTAHICYFIVIASILLAIAKNIPLSDYDRDVSAIVYLLIIYEFVSNKKRYWLILLLIVLDIYILEARTIILSLVAFWGSYYIFHFKKWHMLMRMVLILELIVMSVLTHEAIKFETDLQMRTPLFTGRGLIWGAAVDKISNPEYKYHQFIGVPSTERKLAENFSSTMLDSREGRSDNLMSDLLGGHFHNGLVYTIYNTGIIGCIILVLIIMFSFKSLDYNLNNYSAFLGMFIIWGLNGRSLNGIYVISTMMMMLLLVKLPKRIK